VSGAPSTAGYEGLFVDAGFESVRLRVKEESAAFIDEWMSTSERLSNFVISAAITARKPTGA